MIPSTIWDKNFLVRTVNFSKTNKSALARGISIIIKQTRAVKLTAKSKDKSLKEILKLIKYTSEKVSI